MAGNPSYALILALAAAFACDPGAASEPTQSSAARTATATPERSGCGANLAKPTAPFSELHKRMVALERKTGGETSTDPVIRRQQCDGDLAYRRGLVGWAVVMTHEGKVDAQIRELTELVPQINSRCWWGEVDYPQRPELLYLNVVASSVVGNDKRAFDDLVDLELHHFDSPWRERAEACVDNKVRDEARATRQADGFNALTWMPVPTGRAACDEVNRRMLCMIRGAGNGYAWYKRVVKFREKPGYSKATVQRDGEPGARACADLVRRMDHVWGQQGC